MSYLVLFKFNNATNARFFQSIPINESLYQSENVTVPSGYTPSTGTTGQSPGPSSGFGAPSGPGGETTTFVTLELPSIQLVDQFVQRGYNPLFVFDNQTHSYQYDPNLIDPNTITIQRAPGDVMLTPGDLTAPMDTPLPQPQGMDPQDPIPFLPIYDDPDLRKLLQRTADFPQDPNVLRDPNLNPSLTDPTLDPTQPRVYGEPLPPRTDYFDPNLTDIFRIPEDMTQDPVQQRPDPYVLRDPPYRFTPDPNEIIQPPRSFDPWDPQMNRPSIRPPKYTPISDSGEGGGIAGQQTIFIAFIDAVFSQVGISPPALTNAAIYFSTDGKFWFLANNPVANYLDLKSPRLAYGNGTFMCSFTYTYSFDVGGNRLGQDVCVSSSNGVNWALAMTADAVNQGTSIVKSFNSITNVWTLTNGAVQKNFSIIKPSVPALNGDFISHGVGPMANPNSAASGANVLQNALPSGFTAVRDLFDVTGSGVDFTTSNINSTVVNSGSGWPAAAWTTLFNLNPTGNSQGVVSPFYGAVYSPIGAPLIST